MEIMAPLRSSTVPANGCLLTFFPTLLLIGLGLIAVLIYGGVSLSGAEVFSGAEGGSARLAAFYATPVQRWEDEVTAWADDYALDPNLVATVMQIESCGDPRVRSAAGAAGLFQVMPFHFAAGENPNDPDTNARRGLGYLKQSLDAAGGDVRLALAGYNGGIGVISQPEWLWADETRRYADWGSRMYFEAINGHESSRTLQEWLNSGGSRLCEQAARSRRGWLIP